MSSTTQDRQAKLAELEILERYDAMRERAGYDYGSGQRGAELMRRRRELDVEAPVYGESRRGVTMQELAAAFERVGRPRMARVAKEGYRSNTPTTTRTRATWAKLERLVALDAAPSAGGLGGLESRAAQANLDEKREVVAIGKAELGPDGIARPMLRYAGDSDAVVSEADRDDWGAKAIREETAALKRTGERLSREAFVVYGLKDWQPHAIACRSCADHVFAVVHGAYGNPTDPGLDCELAYEGLCDQA